MFVCFSGMFHGMVVYCPDLDGFTICRAQGTKNEMFHEK